MNSPKYYIAIGASAGGLKAIEELFEHTPADTGHTFIVLQHSITGHKSKMPELLNQKTKMPIATLQESIRPKANHIYLAPSDKNLAIHDGEIVLIEDKKNTSNNHPIDTLFTSLAEDQKEQAVAIILSGTGTDGKQGVRAIKSQGGTILVQQPLTAQFDGMPRAAISTGMTDVVLSPQEMHNHLPTKP